MRVLVTGAGGFIGTHLTRLLRQQGLTVIAGLRRSPGESRENCVVLGDIESCEDWPKALAGVDGVVHLAARVHVLRDRAEDPLRQFRMVNVEATRHLARASAAAGVRRFVYLSSVGVNGCATRERAFTEQDPPRPWDPYAQSKWEAEEVLRGIEAETGLEVVVLRPPLVYGPGNPGNMLRLLRLIDLGVPLPFGALDDNRRSLISVFNLADAIMASVLHPAARSRTYLVSDGEDVSTAWLIRVLSAELRRQARLVSVPRGLLKIGAQLAGLSSELERLSDSLQVDASRIRSELGWFPRYPVQEGLRRTAEWFCNQA